jgi:hypothetical protein
LRRGVLDVRGPRFVEWGVRMVALVGVALVDVAVRFDSHDHIDIKVCAAAVGRAGLIKRTRSVG